MTHEYVIAVGGRIEPDTVDHESRASTAVAWAADHVLAVGPDDTVRSISRGDSTFLDLGGCIVTPLPLDAARADALVRKATLASGPEIDLAALLMDAGLLERDSALAPGSPADLAFWGREPGGQQSDRQTSLRLVAIVRDGAFTEGDEHRGPFPAAGAR